LTLNILLSLCDLHDSFSLSLIFLLNLLSKFSLF
jgi:hypothetical protein